MSKDNIANPDPTAVLDTTAKLFRVLKKVGITLADFAPPVQNRKARKNLKKFVDAGYPDIDELVKGGVSVKLVPAAAPINPYDPLGRIKLAHKIFGKDFIDPFEVAVNRRIEYPHELRCSLGASLPSEEEMVAIRDGGHVLMPLPPRPMSLLDIREADRELFYAKTGGWYAEPRQEFSRRDMAAPAGSPC